MPVSTDLFTRCLPAISTDIQRCGAVTLCDISPTTKDDLASIFLDGSGRFRTMGALVEADFVGKACQVKVNGMYDFLRATMREIPGKKISNHSLKDYGLTEVQPFVLMEAKSPINNEYWALTTGTNTPGTSPGGFAYDYRADVASLGSIVADLNWFPVGIRVFVEGVSTSGTATHTAWKVVDRTIVSSKVRLYLTSQNANSFLPASKLQPPVTGLLMRGTPNVSDYEKFCAQAPGINTTQFLPFFYETVRYTICQDELTDKYINAIRENNPYYKKFMNVESVELTRQLTEDFQRRHAYAAFFNKPLANQTISAWSSLETITVPTIDLTIGVEGKCIGRRANATGFYELLAQCNRVWDLQGQGLNLRELFDELYNMMRIRDSIGTNSEVFEFWMPSHYRPTFAEGMLRYFKMRSEGLLRLNMDLGAKLQQGPLGFTFQEYQLDWPEVKIRIVSHKFMDDIFAAKKAANPLMENAGRMIFCFDWAVMYQGLIQSNSVNNKSGTIQELARVNSDMMCVMNVPQQSQRLISTTYTNVVECGGGSLIIENFPDQIPEHAARVGVPTDLYGTYGTITS